MISVLQLIAALAAGLFAGAALYINVAEHPARMALDTRQAALQWAPSYRRATWIQAPLALISLAAGLAVFWMHGSSLWLIAALLIGAVVPYTLIIVMPTNRKLSDPERNLDTAETRALLRRWNLLHAVRTTLSLIATILYLCALVQ